MQVRLRDELVQPESSWTSMAHHRRHVDPSRCPCHLSRILLFSASTSQEALSSPSRRDKRYFYRNSRLQTRPCLHGFRVHCVQSRTFWYLCNASEQFYYTSHAESYNKGGLTHTHTHKLIHIHAVVNDVCPGLNLTSTRPTGRSVIFLQLNIAPLRLRSEGRVVRP